MLTTEQILKQNFEIAPLLSSSRLILKEIKPCDYSSIIDITMYDGATCKDEEDVKNILKKIDNNAKKGETFHWGIFLKESEKIIGVCGYYRGFKNNCGEIGYVINSEYRGKGFMSEAVQCLSSFGFGTLKLDTIVGYTNELNKASQSVLKKSGFKGVISDQDDLKFELTIA